MTHIVSTGKQIKEIQWQGKDKNSSQIGESKKVFLKWWHLTFKLSAKTWWVRWCHSHVRKPRAGKNHPGPYAKWWNWASWFQLILLALTFYQEQTQIISRYVGKWKALSKAFCSKLIDMLQLEIEKICLSNSNPTNGFNDPEIRLLTFPC